MNLPPKLLAMLLIAGLCPSFAEEFKSAPCRVLEAIAPEFPEIAAVAGVGTEAVIRAEVDRDGNVTSQTYASGHLLFKAASIRAAGRWRFDCTEATMVELIFKFEVAPPDSVEEGVLVRFIPPHTIHLRRGKIPGRTIRDPRIEVKKKGRQQSLR